MDKDFWIWFWFLGCCISCILYMYSVYKMALKNMQLYLLCEEMIDKRDKDLKKREEKLRSRIEEE